MYNDGITIVVLLGDKIGEQRRTYADNLLQKLQTAGTKAAYDAACKRILAEK